MHSTTATSHRASTSTRWHLVFGTVCICSVWGSKLAYETCAPIANPPNTAQLEGTSYHSPKLHMGPCSSVGQTDRHTDGHGQYTFRLGCASPRNVTTARKMAVELMSGCLCVVDGRFSYRRSVNLPRVASFRDTAAFSTDSHLVCERMGVMAAFTSFQHFTQWVRFRWICKIFNF